MRSSKRTEKAGGEAPALGDREKILTAIDKLSEEIAFKEAYLFGSVTKPFRFSERSDIDIRLLSGWITGTF